MTTKQKLQQFKDYYLGGTLAVIAAAALIIFMVSRFLMPQKEAVLSIAVFDTELSDEAEAQLAQEIRTSLGLNEDAEINVNSGFTSVNTNEYSRLSILAADGKVDVVIAGREAFGELAGYGYFKDLSLYLPQDMKDAYAADLMSFTYTSDAAAEDAEEMGELATGDYPFGLSLSGSARWKAMTTESSMAAEEPVLGVIMESEKTDSVCGCIRVMMGE